MRICVISEYYYPDTAGATSRALSELTRSLRDGHPEIEMDVITSRNSHRGEVLEGPDDEDWDGIRIHRLGTPHTKHPSTSVRVLLGMWFALCSLARIATRKRYDVILVVTNPPPLAFGAYLMRKLRGVPYIYLVHDLFPDVAIGLGSLHNPSLVASVAYGMQRRWLNSADRVVVLGRCMSEHLQDRYGLSPGQIDVIPNWACLDTGSHISKEESSFRDKHGLTGHVILFAGNFGQHQSFDVILEAARLLDAASAPVTFVFVGQGAKRDEMAQFVERHHLGNVRILPHVPQDDFGDMMASADISLITLEKGMEGLGVPSKFYNALASARPVLALLSPKCEVARVIQEEDCGVQVDDGNPAHLAEVISSMCSDDHRLDKQGQNAKRALVRNYTLERAVERYYRLIQVIAGGQ